MAHRKSISGKKKLHKLREIEFRHRRRKEMRESRKRGPCGKVMYPNRGEALLAISRFRGPPEDGMELNAYPCRLCGHGAWHVGNTRVAPDDR